MAAFSVEVKKRKNGILGNKFTMCFFLGWVYGILRKESSVYGSLCIVLLKTLKGGFILVKSAQWASLIGDLA